MALVHVYNEVENRNTGIPVAGIVVEVRYQDTPAIIVPIYADEAGTAFSPPNQTVTDADGMYSFYVEPGRYSLNLYWRGVLIKTIDNFYQFPPLSGSNGAAQVGTVDGATVQVELDAFRPVIDTDGASHVPFADPVAPAYLKYVSDIISGLPVSIMRFVPREKIMGIITRANTDNLQPYFADALASGVRELVCPPGLYNVDSAIAMANANQKLAGAGWNGSEIRIRSTTAAAITLASGVAGYGVEGFKITRTGTPVTNADGVRCLGTTDNSSLADLWIEGHWTNLTIGTCDTGHIKNLRLAKALHSGAFQTSSASYGPSQWDVDDVLVDRNTVDGWRVVANTGPAGLILGQMRNIRSFANSGWGLNILGNATTGIYDLRLSDAFMGSDGLGSINLDSYGGKHRISGFFERNGRDPTGPSVATAASGIGVGINVSAANSDAIIYGSLIDGNAYDGVVHAGAVLIVAASQIFDNGQALAVGRRNGILSYSGKLVVGADVITNMGANTSQEYGVAAGHDNVVIGTNHMDGNTGAATTLGGTANAVLVGNSGTPFHRIPTSLAVGDPTGTTGTKSINVATDIKKNGTVYANP